MAEDGKWDEARKACVNLIRENGAPETLRADAYVLALGSYSPLLARPLGIDLAIYPLKGYSVTMPVKNPAAAWTASLSDDAHKLVLSRLGDRLRIAGPAELNGYNAEINQVRHDFLNDLASGKLQHVVDQTGHRIGHAQRILERRVRVWVTQSPAQIPLQGR